MRKFIAGAGTAGLIVVGLGGSPAQATTVAFTVYESQNIYNTDPAVLPTFTASGPLCPSGTFQDSFGRGVAAGHGSKLQLLQGTSVYTCDDGSGTFLASKQVFATGNDDGSGTTTGPFKITGGTGAYAGLHGSGTNTGSATADGDAEATISGTIVP